MRMLSSNTASMYGSWLMEKSVMSSVDWKVDRISLTSFLRISGCLPSRYVVPWILLESIFTLHYFVGHHTTQCSC